ncbi:unnamed protein product [Nesidiocoris tenuis]|uniref:Sec16 Sec23-binding domain-containing protein n=1 Tax=Nesidiocoris tenuis TaxID=355587 RepID=A0A6H5G5U6_9HEMI|nr:unnamed protein product [Nesidiocoris tenuis]
MKIKEIEKTVNTSWSPGDHHPILLAAGTAAQQLDASFNTSAALEIYALNLQEPSLDLELKLSVPCQQSPTYFGLDILYQMCGLGFTEERTHHQIDGYNDSNVEGKVCQALLVGRVEEAVDLCLENDRLADALVLAHATGPEALARIHQKYFEKNNSDSLCRIIKAVVTEEWESVIQNCELSSWKEALAVILTYKKNASQLAAARLEFWKRIFQTPVRPWDARIWYAADSYSECRHIQSAAYPVAQVVSSTATYGSSSACYEFHQKFAQSWNPRYQIFGLSSGTTDFLQESATYRNSQACYPLKTIQLRVGTTRLLSDPSLASRGRTWRNKHPSPIRCMELARLSRNTRLNRVIPVPNKITGSSSILQWVIRVTSHRQWVSSILRWANTHQWVNSCHPCSNLRLLHLRNNFHM